MTYHNHKMPSRSFVNKRKSMHDLPKVEKIDKNPRKRRLLAKYPKQEH